MESFFIAPYAVNGQLFKTFYLAGFSAAGAIAVWEGLRRDWGMPRWLVVIAWRVALAIIGSKLAAISFDAWRDAIAGGYLPHTTAKRYLGLLLVGAVGIYPVRRFLGFRHSILDAFAFSMPIGLAIVRIGCFLNGCCHGTVTRLPWAVAYPVGSQAHFLQCEAGLIDLSAPLSLSVHPTQLYSIAGLMAIVGALWKVRNRLRAPGDLFYLHAALYCALRFALEFVRADGSYALGLKTTQWAVLVGAIACGLVVWVRERRFVPQAAPLSVTPESWQIGAALAALVALFLIGRPWFTPSESIAIVASVLLVLACVFAWAPLRTPKLVIAGRVALGAALATLFPGSGVVSNTRQDSTQAGRSSYWSVELSGVGGRRSQGETLTNGTDDCGNVIGERLARYRYFAGSADLSHTEDRPGYTVTKGVRAFFGRDTYEGFEGDRLSDPGDLPDKELGPVVSFYPHISFDYKYGGLGFGALLMRPPPDGFPLNPGVSVRLGPRFLFVDAGLRDQFVSPVTPFPAWAGFGIGYPGRISLRAGIAAFNGGTGRYLQPSITLPGSRVTFTGFLARGTSTWGRLSAPVNTANLGVRFRLR